MACPNWLLTKVPNKIKQEELWIALNWSFNIFMIKIENTKKGATSNLGKTMNELNLIDLQNWINIQNFNLEKARIIPIYLLFNLKRNIKKKGK